MVVFQEMCTGISPSYLIVLNNIALIYLGEENTFILLLILNVT